jgi:hypothetical protein
VVSESFGGRSAKPKDRESGVNIQYTHVCVQNVSLGEIQSLRDGYYFLSSFSLPPVKARVWKQRWPVVNRTHEEEYGSINLEEKKSRLNGASQFEETSQTHRLDKGTHLGKEF